MTALQADLRQGLARRRSLAPWLALAVGLGVGVGVAARLAQRTVSDTEPTPRVSPALDALGLFERGAAHVDARRWEQAAADFNAALALDPTLHRAYGGLAVSHLQRDDSERALTLVNDALALEPDYVEGLLLRSAIHVEHGQPERALEDCERVLELDPNHPAAWYNRGVAFGALERYRLAAMALQRAFALGYRAPELEVRVATNYLRGGMPERAVTILASLLACRPHRADLQRRLLRATEAKRTFMAQLEELGQLGDAALEARDYAQAAAHYTELLALRPWLVQALLQRSQAYHGGGKPQAGIDDCDHVLRLEPNNAIAYLNRGACRAALGQLAQARADFVQALELDPELVKARRNLDLVDAELRQRGAQPR